MAEKKSAKRNPHQVGAEVNHAVALVEPERGALIGFLDARNKHFLVMPAADMPIGDVSKLCKYDNAKHETRPTIYHRQADAMKDLTLMKRALEKTGSGEYQVVLMPFLAKPK